MTSHTEPMLARLWKENKTVFYERAERLVQVASMDLGQLSGSERNLVVAEARRLSVALGTYGLKDASAAAAAIERQAASWGSELSDAEEFAPEALIDAIQIFDNGVVTPEPGDREEPVAQPDKLAILTQSREYGESLMSHLSSTQEVLQLQDLTEIMASTCEYFVVDGSNIGFLRHIISQLYQYRRSFTNVIVLSDALAMDQRVDLARKGVRHILSRNASARRIANQISDIIERPGATILAIDGDSLMLRFFEKVLGALNFQVVTLNDPDKAWEALETISPQIVILDYDIRDDDSLALLRSIKGDHRYASTPVVVTSAVRDVQTMETIYAAGGDECLLKPFNAENLADRISYRALANEQNQSQAMRKQIFSTISHELKTPLTNITTRADLLQRKADDGGDEKMLKHAQSIRSSATDLDRLINQLLEVSALEFGEELFDKAEYDIGEIIQEVSTEMTEQLESRRQRCRIQKKDPYVNVNVDRAQISRMFTSLLENASKFSPETGMIDVTISRTGGNVVVDVTDEGPGVPEDLRESIFEPLAKFAEGIVNSESGLGIGLAAARKIVEAHSGRLVYVPRSFTGSTFRVELAAA